MIVIGWRLRGWVLRSGNKTAPRSPPMQSPRCSPDLYRPDGETHLPPDPEVPWSPTDVSVFVTDVRRAVDQQSCGTGAQ